jgi:Gar1/Naf1 RNA binding protein
VREWGAQQNARPTRFRMHEPTIALITPTEPRQCVLLELGSFLRAVVDEMLCSSLMPHKVLYFNAPIYLQNKILIGRFRDTGYSKS